MRKVHWMTKNYFGMFFRSKLSTLYLPLTQPTTNFRSFRSTMSRFRVVVHVFLEKCADWLQNDLGMFEAKVLTYILCTNPIPQSCPYRYTISHYCLMAKLWETCTNSNFPIYHNVKFRFKKSNVQAVTFVRTVERNIQNMFGWKNDHKSMSYILKISLHSPILIIVPY